MNQATNTFSRADGAVRPRSVMIGPSFEWMSVLLDAAAIVLSCVTAAALYHWYLEYNFSRLADHAGVGVLIAILYGTVRMARGGYGVKSASSGDIRFLEIWSAWNFAICGVLVVSFLTKITSSYYSRGALVLFYVGGLAALYAVRALVLHVVTRGIRENWLTTSRVLLIGTASSIEDFARRYDLNGDGLRIVETVLLPESAGGAARPALHVERATALEWAVDRARAHRVEDVFLVVPWSEHKTIEQAADAFLSVPARLHLGAERILDRFAGVEISRTGPVASLELARPALGPGQVLMKRIMDAALALCALVALAPFFMILAVVVKLDSPGKVFFRQRRHGFNQEQFEIIKFRSMTTTEDGDDVKQVQRDDLRLTRAGRWLRRTNLDELPQLINVLKGEMSFVGPRPHAVIHNQEYEQKIARYARRHNVKPGITGWAQVNGFRGETDTDAKMRARVKCDLYYIDNWSLSFDAYIIFKTLFSLRAYRNAR
jgi:Undecaprenyl-phosphate glucose phosphotransferase